MAAERSLREPHPDRLPPGTPGRAAILAAHGEALDSGAPTYRDPCSGLSVFTAATLAARATCCDSGCRHCPYVDGDADSEAQGAFTRTGEAARAPGEHDAGVTTTDLSLEAVPGDVSLTLHLRGELDLSTAPQLRVALGELAALELEEVRLELTELEFMDSTGIGIILGAAKRLREAGTLLVLQNPRRSVLRVLEYSGIARAVAVVFD